MNSRPSSTNSRSSSSVPTWAPSTSSGAGSSKDPKATSRAPRNSVRQPTSENASAHQLRYYNQYPRWRSLLEHAKRIYTCFLASEAPFPTVAIAKKEANASIQEAINSHKDDHPDEKLEEGTQKIFIILTTLTRL